MSHSDLLGFSLPLSGDCGPHLTEDPVRSKIRTFLAVDLGMMGEDDRWELVGWESEPPSGQVTVDTVHPCCFSEEAGCSASRV